MSIVIAKVFHADHGVSQELMQELVNTINPVRGFFLRTLDLPAHAPSLMNALYGPVCGDAPISESEVVYKQRSPDRPPSRMVNKPMRPTRRVTVIGEMTTEGAIIFTCHGGEAAEREPGDKSLENSPKELVAASKEFWSKHALAQS